ncbi:MAG: carboxylesterase family protein [Eubacterium sp.]
MNVKKIIKMIIVMCLFFGVGTFFCGGKKIQAQEKIVYTMEKGNSRMITKLLKNHPFLQKDIAKYRNLTWKSSKSKIVEVKANRKLVAKKKGKVYLRGYDKKKKKVVTIRLIVGKKVKKITVPSTQITLPFGGSTRLQAVATPANASYGKLYYEVENPQIISVSSSGKVTSLTQGSTYVSILSKDGNAKKTVRVRVKEGTVRTTTKGSVQGVKSNGEATLIWYGIPYGQSTSGTNRWKAPQAVAPWSGTWSATVPKDGAACYGDGINYSGTEDCLYVNIYRPNTTEKNLPVMVYLHGGGNASGTANTDFSKFATTTGTVVVSVEFRLGAFGYLSHPALQMGTAEENSGNFALLDIKAALQWVQTEIGNFGGNADNVTLTGFSAGARNVMLCMISPQMKGLFHKAIIFSGGCNTCVPEQGKESSEGKLASILAKRGTYATKKKALEYIKSADHATIRDLFYSLTTAEVANMYQSSALRFNLFPQGFNDGVVIPKEGFSVIASGNYNRVPVILGSDATEFSSFALKTDITEALNAAVTTTYDRVMQLGIRYGSQLQSQDYIEKTANLLLQDAMHQPVYAYRFLWGTDPTVTDVNYSTYVGALHGSSKDFLRGYYKNNYPELSPNAIRSDNKSGRKELTSIMQKYIGEFLKSGSPDVPGLNAWNTWNNAPGVNKLMVFDATSTKASAVMDSQMYSVEETFANLKAEANEEEYRILMDVMFKDRNFMPQD